MCRDLAAKLSDAKDRKAVELMALGWEKVAKEREMRLSLVEAECKSRQS